MGINGTAYATWAAPGGGGADVRVARLQDVAWQTIGAPIDVDPARAAGRGVQRSRVAVSGDGNALVAWGEDNADGRRRVWERRVTGLTFSAFPQELSLPSLGGAPGGAADSVDIDVEDDGGFGWAVFRQDFGGGSRSIGRRLLGLTFDPPVPLGGPPTANPRLALNGRGQGLSTFEGGSSVFAAINYHDVFQPATGLNFTPAAGAAPVPAASEHREVVAAWQQNGEVKGRLKPLPAKPFENEVTLSRPGLGAAAGPVAVGADLLGGFAVAMAQGPATSRAITVAVQDQVPGRPGPIARNAWQSGRRAKLRWRPARDLWGQLRYRVVVGGKVAGETTGTSLVPKVTLSGKRPLKYQVIAIDVRGQQTASPVRRVRYDNFPPKFRLRIGGTRRAGGALHVVVKPRDRGSGVREVRVRYGDSKRVVRQRKRFSGRHAVPKGQVHAQGHRVRHRRQPPDQEGQAPHHVRLRAGRRELELGGRPLLMGVLNASPDSFSDAGDHPDVPARGAELVAAGAQIIDVGGESAVGGRPPSIPPLSATGSSPSSGTSPPATTSSSRSTPTSPRWPRPPSRRARG